MRETRNEGALWRFGREVFDKAVVDDEPRVKLFSALAMGRPSHFD